MERRLEEIFRHAQQVSNVVFTQTRQHRGDDPGENESVSFLLLLAFAAFGAPAPGRLYYKYQRTYNATGVLICTDRCKTSQGIHYGEGCNGTDSGK